MLIGFSLNKVNCMLVTQFVHVKKWKPLITRNHRHEVERPQGIPDVVNILGVLAKTFICFNCIVVGLILVISQLDKITLFVFNDGMKKKGKSKIASEFAFLCFFDKTNSEKVYLWYNILRIEKFLSWFIFFLFYCL